MKSSEQRVAVYFDAALHHYAGGRIGSYYGNYALGEQKLAALETPPSKEIRAQAAALAAIHQRMMDTLQYMKFRGANRDAKRTAAVAMGSLRSLRSGTQECAKKNDRADLIQLSHDGDRVFRSSIDGMDLIRDLIGHDNEIPADVKVCRQCGGRGVVPAYGHVLGAPCFRCDRTGRE